MKSLTFLSKKINFMNMPKNGQPCQINIKVAEFVLGLGLWTPTNPHCSPKNKFFYLPWGSSCAEQYPICVWNTKLQKLTSVNRDGLKSFISCLSWVSTLACFKLPFGLSISPFAKNNYKHYYQSGLSLLQHLHRNRVKATYSLHINFFKCLFPLPGS